MSYVVPGVLLYQEFQQVSAEITDPLRAHVSGPHAYLLRYGQAAEKPLGSLGVYNPAADVAYPWPNLPTGALVDIPYVKVFADNARLQYYTDLIGVGSAVAPVAGSTNRVRSADTSGGFVANGASFPRYAGLYDRDVAVGDRVFLSGVGTDTLTYTVDTYVQAVVSTGADRAASVTGAASADAANATTQTAAAPVTLVAGTSPNNTLAANASSFDGRADGYVSDTYTVTVTRSSTGGNFTTALVSVTSASGKDDVASVSPAATGVSFAAGAKGLTLAFTHTTGTDDLVVGQSWSVAVTGPYTTPAVTAAGTYTGTDDTKYFITFTQGGSFAAASPSGRPAYTVTTSTGVDAAGAVVIGATRTGLPVGTRGVTIGVTGSGVTGVRKGDVWYVQATAAKDGAFRTLVLAHTIPAPILTASDLDLKLSISRSVQVDTDRVGFSPLVNWSTSPTQVTLKSGLVAYDPTLTNTGVPVATPVVSADLYVEYRAWRADLSTGVYSISDPAGLDAAIAGPTDPDNPLKFGVYSALSMSNGTAVMYTAVADPASTASWSRVVDLLVGRSDLYKLVPLTQNRAVQNLFQALIRSESGPTNNRWKSMFCSGTLTTQKPVVSSATSTNLAVVLATVAQAPATVGPSFTLVTAYPANANFITNGVTAGDVLRAQYTTSFGVASWSEYVVASVPTEDTLLLAAGPAAALTSPSKVEVWHPLTKDEQAADYGRQGGSFADRRVSWVFPDQIGSAGTQLPGYYLCASLAGLRSGSVPQRGLTNVGISGYDDVSRSTTYFNASQLDAMAGDGTWVVTQDHAGAVKTRHAVTTDPTTVNSREETVVTNVDAISYLILNRVAPFIGLMNVTPSAISRLRIEIVSALQYLMKNGYTDTLGPQLIAGDITSLYQSPLLADRVVCVISLTCPAPLNNLEVHLTI